MYAKTHLAMITILILTTEINQFSAIPDDLHSNLILFFQEYKYIGIFPHYVASFLCS